MPSNHPAELGIRLKKKAAKLLNARSANRAIFLTASGIDHTVTSLTEVTTLTDRPQRELMATKSARSDPEDILDEVIGLLEERGYDGWQLRDVAERAHASLATIYKHFPSRNELIVAAVERWMNEHIYRSIQEPSDDPSLSEALVHVFHKVFEPWEQHPTMLQVFVRARYTIGGERLRSQGYAAVEPLGRLYADKLDPTFVQDLTMILTNAVNGALIRYLNGDIDITDILPNLERTVYRLNLTDATTRPEPPRRNPRAPARTPTNRQRRSLNTAKRG